MPKPKVGDPIVFRAQKDGPEHVVRPCSGRDRELWLRGYVDIQKLEGDLEALGDLAFGPTVGPDQNLNVEGEKR
jgi:hypothetical protein